jgi:hypothetical protein
MLSNATMDILRVALVCHFHPMGFGTCHNGSDFPSYRGPLFSVEAPT